MTIKFMASYQTKPIYVFGTFGLVAFLVSILSGAYAVVLKLAGRIGFPRYQADFVETPLPILSIVFNNSRYGAVRKATLSMFKDGVAGETDGRFLADLDPSPPFDEFVKAQGGHGERVERPEDVPAALKRALDAVRGGKQALLNVITPY